MGGVRDGPCVGSGTGHGWGLTGGPCIIWLWGPECCLSAPTWRTHWAQLGRREIDTPGSVGFWNTTVGFEQPQDISWNLTRQMYQHHNLAFVLLLFTLLSRPECSWMNIITQLTSYDSLLFIYIIIYTVYIISYTSIVVKPLFVSWTNISINVSNLYSSPDVELSYKISLTTAIYLCVKSF